jgi:hypothetical protein
MLAVPLYSNAVDLHGKQIIRFRFVTAPILSAVSAFEP